MTPEEQQREALMLWTLRMEGKLVFWEELDDQCLIVEATRRGLQSFKPGPHCRQEIIDFLREDRRKDPPLPFDVVERTLPDRRAFQKGDRLVCISKSAHSSGVGVGRFYTAASASFWDCGGYYVELERTDSGQTGCCYFTNDFVKVP